MSRTSRSLLALVVLGAAAPALAGCATHEDGIGVGTVANTVVRYYRGLESKDCSAIKAELVPDWAATVDCAHLADSWDGLSSADVSYPRPATRIEGDVATVVATVRRQPAQPGCSGGVLGSSEVTHQLVADDGAWRIANIVVSCR